MMQENCIYEMTVLPPTKYQFPNHPSYHGPITGEEAKRQLQLQNGQCFLFRYSEAKKKYLISVKECDENEVTHIRVEIDKDMPSYQLEGTQKPFKSLGELIKYYQKNPLSPTLRGIGEPCPNPNASHSICSIF